MKINVYDFDDTIYDGDSSIDFYVFCLKKNPWIIRYLLVQSWGLLMYLLGVYSKTEFKEKFYSFLKGLKDTERYVDEFWAINNTRIKEWYRKQRQKHDLIISASPEFLLQPLCDQLGVQLIASKVHPASGVYSGVNCYGEEKVKRFKDAHGAMSIHEFYSDSLSDSPLAYLAERSIIVHGSGFSDWDSYREEKGTRQSYKEVFLSREFFRFLLIGTVNVINGVFFAMIYSLMLQNNLAFILGYMTSLTISYILNSLYTFRETFSGLKYGKFILSYLPNFIIQNICVLIFMNGLGWDKLPVYIMAAVIGVPVTFLCMKFFAFS